MRRVFAAGRPAAGGDTPFEGAGFGDPETVGWVLAQHRDADADLLPAKPLADARTRDLRRNDALIQAAERIRQDSIVGARYVLHARPDWRYLGLSAQWAEEFQEEVESRFTLFAESPDNWLDATGRAGLTGLTRQAIGQSFQHGEVLAVVKWLRGGDRPYRTAIQMIDPGRLRDPVGTPAGGKTAGGKTVRGGIEFDRHGRPVACHIHDRADTLFQSGLRSRRVPFRLPWGRAQVIHLFMPMHVEQSRGIPDLTAALIDARAARAFRRAVLQQQHLAATLGAFVESDLPAGVVAEALGGGGDVARYMRGFNDILQKLFGRRGLRMGDGVRVPVLPPGSKMNWSRPDVGMGNMDLEKSHQRIVAAGTGISYEQLTGDYADSNYASSRASAMESWKRMEPVKRQIADRFADIVYRLWLEEAIAGQGAGRLETVANPAHFYRAMNRDAYARAIWVGASRGQVDELKETRAAIMRMEAGLSSLEAEAARLGLDWRDLQVQRAREQRRAAELARRPG